ncbi:pantoate--beta-alanine ligase [Microbacterium sp. LRZ72]|uniref:4-phosphopantoate--beta-alanine ligase n=1 Tax=Microbacterium sp. LRZ72 TaxID=2942481 RepID=UPI0029A777B9|nr:pantoate--beta-alanine ligase [Microbacterium sp. LRZ72]MDX2377828.1 pantoate--beta-alanine ligase [Microbacterium sp. LRZ72]
MIRSVAGLRARLAEERGGGATSVALVSTIGALHAGHEALIREAGRRADVVVVSSFLNPLRFASAAELAAYPRTPEADARMLERLGVDVVFAPEPAELLPAGHDTTRISAGDHGLRHEGRGRPRYFDGLLTVEAMLLQLIRPEVAVYGLRDRQRVFLVERMVRDLFFGVEIATVETVRDPSGLPVSSRVSMLEGADLAAATRLPVALEAAASCADRGVDACIAAAQSALMGQPRIRLEYLAVIDPHTFLPADEGHSGPALALIAATVAGHRFIDNVEIYLH